jgi:Undecaprenyl-phosphate glucose phosphotransferase
MLSSDQSRDALTPDATAPWNRERSAPGGNTSWLGAARSILDRLYSDKLGSISRPKLLFTLSLVDMAVIVATGLVAHAVTNPSSTSLLAAVMLSVFVALSTAVALRRNWSYSVHALRHPTQQIEKIVKSVATVFLLVAGGLHLVCMELYSPSAMLIWLAMAASVLVASRYAVAGVLERLTAAGRLVRRTVLVGGGPDAEALIAALEGDNVKELHILGVFDDRFDERSAANTAGYPKLGNFDQLSDYCRNNGVDLLIITVPVTAEQRLLQILQRMLTLPVDIRISALSSKLRLSSSAYSYIGRVPMLALMDKPLTDWDRVVKNIEDRVLGALLLLLAAPVMALVALAVRLGSKGPIFFKQRRYGFNNELIEVLKFRSMYTEASDASASKLVTRDDPRVTPVGRFIRKTSLDELPQLINVVRGEMSLVGPRPHATEAKASSDLYQTVVDGYYARHRMKPGVTGWAQINGWRGETDTHEKIQRRVEADLYYIDNWSVLLDLYIIAMTPLALLSRKNAY